MKFTKEYIESITEFSDDITELDICELELKKLPKLPKKLVVLNCGYNKLTSLPELPITLNILICDHNELSSLPHLPNNLITLICDHNKLINLPQLSINLMEIYCEHNKLTSLPELPDKLIKIDCSFNKLAVLPKLPNSLIILGCNDNELMIMPEFPVMLQQLYCYNNKLKTFSLSILNCRRLIYALYSNNPIEYLDPRIIRFIENSRNGQQIYNDAQSIHNSNVQLGLTQSINNLMKEPPIITNSVEYILNDDILNCKELLLNYINDKTIHIVLHLTFEEIFIAVINEIERSERSEIKDEIKKVLNIEMKESECKCFTGRITRLVNSLNGFSDKVNIGISENEQISNVIINVKNQMIEYSVKTHKKIAEKRLLELGYLPEIIAEYLNFIEE